MAEPQRLACVDIGSNTTRLLVADREDGRLSWVHQERAFTRIGEELLAHGCLRTAKIAEVVDVVRDQLARARSHGVTRVCTVATAGVRGAPNGEELAAAVTEATGLPVRILSDREEARLAFVGVAGTLEERPGGVLGVVDVGGGSSELVVGTAPDQVSWWASLPLGSTTLAALTADPVTDGCLASVRARVAAELARLEVPRPEVAVAAGGSATSLGRLVGPVLDGPSLRRALALLRSEPAVVVARRFSIDLQRVRLLPAGLLILEAASSLFGTALSVGRGGIREGVLLEA